MAKRSRSLACVLRLHILAFLREIITNNVALWSWTLFRLVEPVWFGEDCVFWTCEFWEVALAILWKCLYELVWCWPWIFLGGILNLDEIQCFWPHGETYFLFEFAIHLSNIVLGYTWHLQRISIDYAIFWWHLHHSLLTSRLTPMLFPFFSLFSKKDWIV